MIKISTLLVATAGAIAAVGHVTAAEPKLITYPAGMNTPVSITLIQRQGNLGRDNPFYDNYRPQLQFSGEKQPMTCTVRVSPSQEKVEPGQTVEVAINCGDKFKVREDEKSFTVFEGGRKVAAGNLL